MGRTMHDEDDHWLRRGSTSSDETREVYDQWAETYDETLQEWGYSVPAYAAELLHGAMPADSVTLDAGCGTGLTGLALRTAGFVGPIDGIDLSPVSLQEAEKRGVYRTLTAMDLQKLPLAIPSDAYDVVLCAGVLTYVPDGESVLREFARVARSGGRILITQRNDLFRERAYRAMFDDLADVLEVVAISDPLPYLPNNPDFGEEIKVIYAMMTVT